MGIKKIEVIGSVDVDSGLLMVGDPCYFTGTSWADANYNAMLDDLFEDHMHSKQHVSIPHERGHDGMGVVFGTAWGDGTYPVIAVWTDSSGGWDSSRPTQIIVDTDPAFDVDGDYKLPSWIRA